MKVGDSTLSGCARDHLMWMLMQCIIGTGGKSANILYEYLAFIRLYDLLYHDTEPVAVPECNDSHCVISFAVASIWAHMQRKSLQSTEQQKPKNRPLPSILKHHLE